MTYGENQMRQFYVVTGDPAEWNRNTSTSTTPGNVFYPAATAIKKRLHYVDASGEIIPTDIIENIREARISQPAGRTCQTWTISLKEDTTITEGETYIVNIEFANCFGFGENDRYMKHGLVVGKTGMTAATFYKTLAQSFARNILREAWAPVDVYYTATSVILVEKAPAVVNMENATIRGYFDLPLRATITCSEIGNGNTEWLANMKEYRDVMWYLPADTTASTATATKLNKSAKDEGEAAAIAATVIPNGYTVADMEYFFSKGRADMYGYINFPDINPSKMIINSTNIGATYFFLDIKYFLQEEGMLNQNSEKELTLVCTVKNTLLTLAEALGATKVIDTVPPTDENPKQVTEIKFNPSAIDGE